MQTKRCDRCGTTMGKNKNIEIKPHIPIDMKAFLNIGFFSMRPDDTPHIQLDLCDTCVFCFLSWWDGPKPRVE